MTRPTRLGPAEAAARILEALEAGRTAIAALRIDVDPPVRRVLCVDGSDAGEARGSLGDAALDRAVDALALDIHRGEGAWGRHAVGSAEVYLELHAPRPALVVVGAGHIARPLCTLGHLLGFRVQVADDRPDFATRERFPEAERVVTLDFRDPFQDLPLTASTHLVLVTRGHKYDYECLRHALQGDVLPRYIGMIGSRRRVRATLVRLRDEGVPLDRLEAVRAPVGLDVGAETPEEIAVAVAAEMVLLRRGGSGAPLRDRERIVERFLGAS